MFGDVIDEIDEGVFEGSLFRVEYFGAGCQLNGNPLLLLDYLELDSCNKVVNTFGGVEQVLLFEPGYMQIEPALGLLC